MAFSSLRYFPVVKLVPFRLSDLNEGQLRNGPLGTIVGDAITSLKDIESIWLTNHDAAELTDRFRVLLCRLDSLKKDCESNNAMDLKADGI